MSEPNQLTNCTKRKLAYKRAVAVSAAIVMALLISLTLTVKAHAAGQLTITVSKAGMTPTSATIGGGLGHLKIENNSGQDSVTQRISRESGGVGREITLPEGTRELSTEVERPDNTW